jgi:hypothetical protein
MRPGPGVHARIKTSRFVTCGSWAAKHAGSVRRRSCLALRGPEQEALESIKGESHLIASARPLGLDLIRL